MPIDDSFAWWFSGLVDGEGTFKAFISQHGRPHVAFTIKLRWDDHAILDTCARTLGIGKVYRVSNNGWNRDAKPQAMWNIARFRHIAYTLLPLLETHPLRSKKLRDFTYWAECVHIVGIYKDYPQRTLLSLFNILSERAKLVKVYHEDEAENQVLVTRDELRSYVAQYLNTHCYLPTPLLIGSDDKK